MSADVGDKLIVGELCLERADVAAAAGRVRTRVSPLIRRQDRTKIVGAPAGCARVERGAPIREREGLCWPPVALECSELRIGPV